MEVGRLRNAHPGSRGKTPGSTTLTWYQVTYFKSLRLIQFIFDKERQYHGAVVVESEDEIMIVGGRRSSGTGEFAKSKSGSEDMTSCLKGSKL